MRRTLQSATRLFFCTFLAVALPACSLSKPTTNPNQPVQPGKVAEGRNFARWEKSMAAFEAADEVSPPDKGGVLFIGSSTIRRWDTLEQDFPGHAVINRGFGGSQIVDSTHFAERIIFPYEPRMVVLRAGGNDIHAGKSPGQVYADYMDFVKKVRAGLPDVRIVFICSNPTPARWSEWEDNKVLNLVIEEYARRRPYLHYLELEDLILDADGQPRPELFMADRLHFSAKGYQLLADRLRPLLASKP